MHTKSFSDIFTAEGCRHLLGTRCDQSAAKYRFVLLRVCWPEPRVLRLYDELHEVCKKD